MRGLTVAILSALGVVGAPAVAAADTVKGLANAGPALAGDTVVWGQEYADGRAAIYARAPGQPARAVLRLAAVKGKGHKRDFGGIPGALSASPTRLAYALQDSVATRHSSDSVGIEASVKAQLSIAGGAFTDPLGCAGAYVTTAAEGDVVAIGVNGQPPCAGVWIAGAPARRISATTEVRQVRLAGPWVAWLEGTGGIGRQITVADVATGAKVATFPATSPRRAWQVFDLDDRGTFVAATGAEVVTFTLTDRRPRVIARRIWSSTVATAGGRVAYIAQNRRSGPGRLLLTDLTGRVLRRLDRYGPARRPTGEVALTNRRAAWSVLRTRDENTLVGPGSVLTVSF